MPQSHPVIDSDNEVNLFIFFVTEDMSQLAN